MKCKFTAFAITILCFATIAVAQPAEGPSERELLCRDIVAFAFPESRDPLALQSGLLVEQSGDSSDILLRTFYPEEGLPHLRTRGFPRWGLSNHASPGDQSRGIARLDRIERNQTIQEQSRVLYNMCKTPLDPSK